MRRQARGMAITMMAFALCTAATVRAEDGPVQGTRGELMASMNDAGGKIEELAGAVPAGKYAWRPGKGVRSAGEVFLHVCQGNYLIPTFVGAKPPIDLAALYKMDTMDADKAKVQQMLKDSYAFANKVITDMPDSELDTQVDVFGQKMSKRAALIILVSHSHEHLGQSIAYARTNGITPPWTAREQAEAAKKAAEKKAQGK